MLFYIFDRCNFKSDAIQNDWIYVPKNKNKNKNKHNTQDPTTSFSRCKCK
jgi:hypothetical protein